MNRKLLAAALLAALASEGAAALPGDLDTSFNGGDFLVLVGSFEDQEAVGMLQPDGSVLAGGFASEDVANDASRWAFVRRKPDGSLDPSFGAGAGSVTVSRGALHNGAGPTGSVNDLVVQQDGSILGVGYGYDTATSTHYNAFLTRLGADGHVDTTYGHGGAVQTALGTTRNEAQSVALQKDGMAVVAGSTIDGTVGVAKPVVVRYTTSGQLDTGFGNKGFFRLPAWVPTREWGPGTMVNLLPDGHIVVGTQGEMNNDLEVLRLTPDGRLDRSFGNDGIASVPLPENLVALVVLPDGRMIGAGNDIVFRLDADGSLDRSFNGIGSLPLNLNITAIAPLPTGEVLVTGNDMQDATRLAVARITANGTLDASFTNAAGQSGIVEAPGPGGIVAPSSIAVQPDGRFVITGDNEGEFLFARFSGTPLRLRPADIAFSGVTGVPVSTVQVSNVVRIDALTKGAVVPITVSGGSYSINGDPFTNRLGYVHDGDQVMVEHTSAAAPATTVTTTLQVGGINARNSPWLVRGTRVVAKFTSTTQ